IVRAGIGVNNININAATDHGIIVENEPDGNSNAAAEHSLWLMGSIARNIPQAYFNMKRNQWEKKKYQGVELWGKTLGIIGC
ncbi:NAD(P)-dependent oxidoreductase, partial [Nanoarchaeota archaeon]